jgi:hypothetical protein
MRSQFNRPEDHEKAAELERKLDMALADIFRKPEGYSMPPEQDTVDPND